MPALAEAGFYVIAPDQRGYGRTTGWDADYDGDLASFRIMNLVRDVTGLSRQSAGRFVEAVVGHDFGSPVAAWCALLRPDIFRRVALMSAPIRRAAGAGLPVRPPILSTWHWLRSIGLASTTSGITGRGKQMRT